MVGSPSRTSAGESVAARRGGIDFARFIAVNTKRARQVPTTAPTRRRKAGVSRQVDLLVYALGQADEHGHCLLDGEDYRALGIPKTNAHARVIAPLIKGKYLLPGSVTACVILSPSLFQQGYRTSKPCPHEGAHFAQEVIWKTREREDSE